MQLEWYELEEWHEYECSFCDCKAKEAITVGDVCILFCDKDECIERRNEAVWEILEITIKDPSIAESDEKKERDQIRKNLKDNNLNSLTAA